MFQSIYNSSDGVRIKRGIQNNENHVSKCLTVHKVFVCITVIVGEISCWGKGGCTLENSFSPKNLQ